MIFINIWIISRTNINLGRWKNNLKKTTFSNYQVSRFNSHISPNPIEVTITETNYVFSIHEFFMQTVWLIFHCTKVNYAISCIVPMWGSKEVRYQAYILRMNSTSRYARTYTMIRNMGRLDLSSSVLQADYIFGEPAKFHSDHRAL